MNRIPPIAALRSLEAVVRLGSAAAAALELHVTQSAISHQIRQIEGWFGFALFERHGKRLRALPVAEDLARGLGSAFLGMAQACRAAEAHGRAPAVTVAAIPSVATCWLIPRLPEFRRQHPGIRVRVVYALQGSPVDFEEVDIAIHYGKPEWRGCRVTPFLDGTAAPVASPAYVAQAGPFPNDASLAAASLLHDTDRSGWHDWFRLAGLSEAAEPEGPVYDDFNLLRAAMLAGQGIALSPLSLLVDDLAADRLVQLSPIAVARNEGYWVLEPEAEAGQSGAIAAFKAWLLATPQASRPTAEAARWS